MIYLLPIGEIDLSILLRLKRSLKIAFEGYNINVDIYPEEIQLDNFNYDVEREQYHASKILKKISKIFREKLFFRILGVIDKDIYTKNYNFIFGIANPIRRLALISITRLRENFYKKSGLIHRTPKSKNEFDIRVFKESIHELGHTSGLEHCFNSCVMNFSNSLADTDNKPVNFCLSCSSKLNIDED
ncbi:hypothetical protein LCGC14_2187070 [marine sediment metagenome]|uniref:Archaemetzincin n=1 Tax=marine sediment metagenome TaxID=412755 RepID=A0A0F9E7U3_9ZZZZ